MNDRIYADVACRMLETLAHEASDAEYASQDRLATLLGVSVEGLKRTMGTKSGGQGWPRGYDYIAGMRAALYEIALGFAGPNAFISCANEYLIGSDVTIAGLAESLESLDATWPTNELVADNEPFARACDIIITRCQRGSSATAGAYVGFGTTVALPAFAFSLVADEPHCADFGKRQIVWKPDGLGAVDDALPASGAELLARIVPSRLLRDLEHADEADKSAADVPGDETAAADQLLNPILAEESRRAARAFFASDNGIRFTKMVENCQLLFTAFRDDDLLMQRCSRLFALIAESSPHPGNVRESLSLLKWYSRGDAPRVLATATLSLLIGPESNAALKGILDGR